MSSSLRWFASLVLLFSATTQVWADAGIPFCPLNMFVRRDPPPHLRVNLDPEYDLVIVRDPTVKEAELRIPRRLLVADASAPAGTTRTAMVGLALSAAVVGGGLWCLRFRPREIPKKKLLIGVAVIVVLFAGVAFVGYADANMPPPIPQWKGPPLSEIPSPPIQLGDIAVNVRIVEQGDRVELVVPSELADKIAIR